MFNGKNEKIGIIGTGNVGWHLTQLLINANIEVSGILIRKISKAKAKGINKLFNVPLEDNLENLAKSSTIIIIAVNDDNIEEMAKNLTGFEGIVCHTSGSVNLNTLARHCKKSAVLYPLQTLSKEKIVNPADIPFCIEAVSDDIENKLIKITESMGCNTIKTTSDQRLMLHVAAVLVCNFTNHLLNRAKNILDQNDINFEILYPLISETLNKATSMDPFYAQTGPAIRNDIITINKHLKALSSLPQTKKIYSLLTESIIEHHKKK